MTYLTTAEVAAVLRLTTTATVSAYAREGRFPGAFQVGTDWRIPQSGLDAYIEQQTPTPRGALTPRNPRSTAARKAAATRRKRTP